MSGEQRQLWKSAAEERLRDAIREGNGPDRFDTIRRDLHRDGFPGFALDHLDRVAHKHYAALAGYLA